jgi:hypothetical protein
VRVPEGHMLFDEFDLLGEHDELYAGLTMLVIRNS